MTRRFLIFLLLIITVSCKKNDLSDPVPSIEFVSASSTSVLEGQSLTFRISYKDGDGDLGEDTPNAYNLFLTDNRVNITYKYRVMELAPSNSSIIIRGNLDVVLSSTVITDGSNSQSATFSIYVKDRAGHQSNTVTSPSVLIHS